MAPQKKIPSHIEFAKPGTLLVHVIKANNLPVGDFLSSDPYVIVSLANQRTKTSVKNSDLNPTWNEHFEFRLPSDSHSAPVLTAEVWDKDLLSRDDFLGKVSIDLGAEKNKGSVAYIAAKLTAMKPSTAHDLGTLYLRLTFPC